MVSGGFGAITESWVKDKSPEQCLASVEIYDPASNTWHDGPDLPSTLCAMGVVKYYATIYVLGKAPVTLHSYNQHCSCCLRNGALSLLGLVSGNTIDILSPSGGENDDDVSNSVYYLTEDERWEKKDEMVSGVTETSIHSSYAVLDIDMDMAV
jgi:hypothetical protein